MCAVDLSSAQTYNRNMAAAGLWAPAAVVRLIGEHDASSEAFARRVAGWQAEHTDDRGRPLAVDGKLGPGTWRAMRPNLGTKAAPTDAQALPDRVPEGRVDTSGEALRRLRAGLSQCSEVVAEDVLAVLQGDCDRELALRVYRGLRMAGKRLLEKHYWATQRARKVANYEAKCRRWDVVRKWIRLGGRWWKWRKHVREDRRAGVGLHWTGSSLDLLAGMRGLLTSPQITASNVGVGYDGSAAVFFPTFPDGEDLVWCAHGAHNPACFGVDLMGACPVERGAGGWLDPYDRRVPDEIVAHAGIIDLADRGLRQMTVGASKEVPWGYRSKGGSATSRYYLAPTWEQAAMAVVLGRVHAALYGWTEEDVVLCSHHQRADSRTDVFHFPLKWARRDILDHGRNLVAPDAWLARMWAGEVSVLVNEYRREVRGTPW